MKFAGGKDDSYSIIMRGLGKNLQLVVRMIDGEPGAYFIVDKQDYVLQAGADITLEQVMAYLVEKKEIPDNMIVMLFEKGRPNGEQVKIKISLGRRLSSARELVDNVGGDIEDFVDAVEIWKDELKQKNDRRRAIAGSKLVE